MPQVPKQKFICSLCAKDKKEKHPYFTRIEHKDGKVVRYGICTPCIKLTRKKNQHFYK